MKVTSFNGTALLVGALALNVACTSVTSTDVDVAATDTVGQLEIPPQPKVCEPGFTFCQGADLWTCSETGTDLSMTTCAGLCDEGQCIEACTPNTSQCLTVMILEICTVQGLATTMTCDNGCIDGACQEVSNCTPGEIVCDKAGRQLIKCNSFGTAYFTFEKCPATCSEETDECVEIVCVPGQKRCSPSESKVIETCEPDGENWKPTKFCPGKCVDGACEDVNCVAGELQCGEKGIEKCNDDESGYTLVEPCDTVCALDGDGEPMCAICLPDTTKCKGQIVQKCVSTIVGWQDYLQCGTLQTCVDGQCANMVTLDPQVPMKTNYLTLTKAFALCWQGQAAGMCRSINTTGVTYPIAPSDISDWFCDEAKEGDFFDESAYEAAHDIMGCGITNLEDMNFKTGTINPNLFGVECIGYGDSEIIIDYCVNL